MTSQRDFAAALLDPSAPVPAGLMAPGKRFDIYRNNVVASLADALAQTFPVVERMVGHDYFRALAVEFIRHNPPASRIVARYGGAFAAFLEDFEPLRDFPYLPDMARLEFARLQALQAPALAQPSLNVLEDPEQLLAMTIGLHPGAQVIVSDHPVNSLWQSHQDADPGEVEWQAESLVIFRQHSWVTHLRLEWWEANSLSCLRFAPSLGDALITIHDQEDAAQALHLCLDLLAAGGLIQFSCTH